jgi:hypothetical protein
MSTGDDAGNRSTSSDGHVYHLWKSVRESRRTSLVDYVPGISRSVWLMVDGAGASIRGYH